MKKRFKPKQPKYGEKDITYWFIDSSGKIGKSHWSGFRDHWDENRYKIGNCFKSKGDAVKARRFIRISLLQFHKTL